MLTGRAERKQWEAALRVAAIAQEKPGIRIGVVTRDWPSARRLAALIGKAAEHLGVDVPKFRPGMKDLSWGNGSRARLHLTRDHLDQCGIRHNVVWANGLGRERKELQTMEAIVYNLQQFAGELGPILETGTLCNDIYPQLGQCEPWLIKAAVEFLDLNDAWATAWTVRDSDAGDKFIRFRWSQGLDECVALISDLSGAPEPMFCLFWPGQPTRNSITWVGGPSRHEPFAAEISLHRWDRGASIRPPLLEGKHSAAECVATALRVARAGRWHGFKEPREDGQI